MCFTSFLTSYIYAIQYKTVERKVNILCKNNTSEVSTEIRTLHALLESCHERNTPAMPVKHHCNAKSDRQFLLFM